MRETAARQQGDSTGTARRQTQQQAEGYTQRHRDADLRPERQDQQPNRIPDWQSNGRAGSDGNRAGR